MDLPHLLDVQIKSFEHFLAMAREAQEAIHSSGMSPDKVAAGVRELFAQAHQTKLPDYVSNRLTKLETLVNMVEDDEWQLPEEDLERVLSAIASSSKPAQRGYNFLSQSNKPESITSGTARVNV